MSVRASSRTRIHKKNTSKLFTKQKRFSPRLQEIPSALNATELPVDFVNEISVFETLRAYRGQFFKGKEHLKRLTQSAAAIGRVLPQAPEEILRWLTAVLDESGFQDAMVRVSLHWARSGETRLLAVARLFKEYPGEIYQEGVCLKTSASRRWTLKAQSPQIKSSQYVPGVLSELDRTALEGDIREFIFLDQSGFAAEGTVSNIFVVSGKRVLTPGSASGILNGISRQVVIDAARKRGLSVSETMLTRHEIYSADECFMTNTSSEVLPVVKVDGRIIGSGKPGPVSRILREDFKKAVRQRE